MESVLDKTLVRDVLYPGIEDIELATKMAKQDFERTTGSDFLPLVYHCPVSIAIGKFSVQTNNTISWDAPPQNIKPEGVSPTDRRAWTDGLVRLFWEYAEKWDGLLFSFNGRGYDFPVLELHAIRLGLQCPKYFQDSKNSFRHRYGRHIDIMDLLSNYGAARRVGGLDALLKFLGLPGKEDIAGKDVDRIWDAGEFDRVDSYCRSDTEQTFQFMRLLEVTRGSSGISGSGPW